MSAENEDSQMLSSAEASDNDVNQPPQATTPKDSTSLEQPIMSPPDSHHGGPGEPHMDITPPAPSSSANGSANSNGKRPLTDISNGNDDVEEVAAMANGKARQEPQVRTHEASGYTWSRVEDEPGYAWMHKKAAEEQNRTWDQLVHKDCGVRNRYGDPLEAVEREQAILASLKQQ